MTAAVTPQDAETPSQEQHTAAPRVLALLIGVDGADLGAALFAVRRQVYQPELDVVVVGPAEGLEGHRVIPDLESAIREAGQDVDYLWILHADARPRPDALRALVSEVERNEASLGGSKLLVAGTPNQLESVGSATDVFGEPYSGLEDGEIDLQQYDVVREVAFVRSASMLVRRDLAQGLRGLDVLLPPIAAGLDFSQRSRLAGGRVISVPSSEVYHQGKCNERPGGWREQAGRRKAMLTAYRPLTLVWVVPYDFIVSVLDSLANLMLGRWRPATHHAVAWLWNLYHVPSTIRLRSRHAKVRVSQDEELFRFQTRGSVRLREIGTELTERVLGLFDDDQALARGARRVWSAPGIWGAVVAGFIALFAARSLILIGMPDVAYTLPFEGPGVALRRWMAGWNDAGLGSPDAVHPSTLVTALVTFVALGAGEAARTMATVATALIGVVGMGRLGGRIGLRGPGRYLAGLVLMGGPGTAVLAGAGSWTVLGAAAALPWMIRAALVPDPPEHPRSPGQFGWTLLLGLPLAALSPLLVVVPLLATLLMSSPAQLGRRLLVGAVGALSGVVALPFLLGDPGWITDPARRMAVMPDQIWIVIVAVAAAPTILLARRWRWTATVGATTSLGALLALHAPIGPGAEEALLVVSSLGAGLIVAAGLDVLAAEPIRLASGLAALAVLVVSLGPLANGRYGLPSGDVNDRYGFGVALAGGDEPGRILVVSGDRDLVPGDARSGPGFWYRLVDASGITHHEGWLPPPRLGDVRLGDTLEEIAAGAVLRPGQMLAPFAVDWVVIEGPELVLEEVLIGQLDLLPTPLATGARVYENQAERPLATGPIQPWSRSGTGFAGPPGGRVRLAVNFHPGWSPDGTPDDWAVTVDGTEGSAAYRALSYRLALALATPAVFAGAVALIGWGRRRRRT